MGCALALAPSVAVVQVATPALLTVCDPQPVMLVPLSLKATVPVGDPAPGAAAVTVAVKVTDWPKTDVAVGEMAVVESALPTVWLNAPDVGEAVKLLSPPYVARTECVPTVSDDSVQVAAAPDTVCAAQLATLFPSNVNETLPVGEPPPGAVTETVAVKVTDWPKT